MKAPNSKITWPPAFKLKRHPRARLVKLKASLKHGLEIVVPPHFNIREIPSILELNKLWILKQLIAIEEQQQPTDTLPTVVEFAAIQQSWRIEYIAMNQRLKIMTRPQQELVLYGKIDDKTQCKELLTAWIKDYAKSHLIKELDRISKLIDLPFKKIIIRDQSTRWGSCTADKNINLSYKLIFLPPHLVSHVIIHELCHTVHLDHSKKFWRLVSSFDANWEVHKRELREAGKYIPNWI